MNPLVSIIVPTYNSARYVSEAVESALKQDYSPIEVIVINDGSNDNTKDVLEPYLGRIIYIYKENGGPASARNVGIKQAQGEYIAFLDSDDTWLPYKLEKQIALFKQDESIGLVHSHCISFKKDISEILQQREEKNNGSFSAYVFPKLFWRNFIVNSSVVIKKECFQTIDLFDERESFISVEDYDLWLRISMEYKIGYIKETLVGYRKHTKGISKEVDRFYQNQREVIGKAVLSYPDIEKSTGVSKQRRFAKLYLDYGLDLLEQEKLREAGEKFSISLKYYPFNLRSLRSYIKCLFPGKLFKILKYTKRKFSK
jgi:glycosyltransferase involved in cell wall biosynthesis